MKSWKAKDLNRALQKRGAVAVRQKGSHRLFRFENCQSVVPQHNGDVPVGTVKSIEKDFEPVFGKGWLK
jgi:predicted RNA binding protein YcfA (HicA-like mRNA interferase family)